MEELFKYCIILDLEATCGNVLRQEIIEFSAVLIDLSHKRKIAEFQQYVKPENEPILTNFCKKLTGIKQINVDNGLNIIDTFKLFNKWIKNNGLNDDYIVMTCGDWDLQTMIPNQCDDYGIHLPSFYNKWMNIQIEFGNMYGINKKEGRGMMKMLKHLGIRHIGRHHSGLDDCRNLANILICMLDDGYIIEDKNIRYLG